jgi:hypothetical protein
VPTTAALLGVFEEDSEEVPGAGNEEARVPDGADDVPDDDEVSGVKLNCAEVVIHGEMIDDGDVGNNDDIDGVGMDAELPTEITVEVPAQLLRFLPVSPAKSDCIVSRKNV